MTILRGDFDAALKRPDPRIGLYLIYGPDTGLVAERARRAAESGVDDPTDPFQLIRLDGDAVAGDPGRLADEAGTIGLFGARRAIWVRPTSRNLAAAVQPLLEAPPPDTRIVIEAGDLPKTSPLRALCEKSPHALAVPCYADTDRDLGAVVDDTLKRAGLTIDRDARTALLASLGGDRLATRSELEKLLLYAYGSSSVGLEDIDACLSDVSGLALDAVVDAAFVGDGRAADEGLRRLIAEGSSPATVLGALLRHAFSLLGVCARVEAGTPPAVALESWRGLFFKRKDAVQRQVGLWGAGTLQAAIGRIQATILETRRSPDLAEALISRAVLELARQARADRR